jgi:F-type H+-transporting ATPase subunit b
MSIDWFTFTAQILNFVLLVWLLKRFLYRPILNAIAAREKRISEELANAAEVQAEAKSERERFQHKNEEFERQREALLARAREEARAETERLFAEAREASDAFGRKRMQALRDSVDNLNEVIGRRLQQQVFAISDKILQELASQSLQERMIANFVSRLQALDADTVGDLRAVVDSDGQTLLLRSAFELPARQRAEIQSALKDICGADIDLRFETEPALISGVELIANGHKIAWSVSDYLAALEKKVGEIMPRPDSGQQPAAGAESRENTLRE